jgi:hypothetical protein
MQDISCTPSKTSRGACFPHTTHQLLLDTALHTAGACWDMQNVGNLHWHLFNSVGTFCICQYSLSWRRHRSGWKTHRWEFKFSLFDHLGMWRYCVWEAVGRPAGSATS